MDRSDSLLTRLLRYAQTSSSVVATAAKFASEEFLGISLDHFQQAQALKAVLGNLKGPVMKVAQFLATVPGALPEAYAKEFLALQTNAPAMGEGFVRRRMVGELGGEWEKKFQSFELTSSYAASLGQVHKATLLSGETVACKLQYPSMESIVEADVSQLKFVLSVYETFNKSLQTSDIFAEIKEKLFDELDYVKESKNISLYRSIFANDPDIHVPTVYDDYTTTRLLTMDWFEGQSVLNYQGASLDMRNRIGQLLFRAWYYPLYHHGVIHGDPHPGNYHVNKDKGIHLLDFGCVRFFSTEFIKGVVDLYQSLKNNDRDRMVQAYEAWGFTNLTGAVIDVMGSWAKLLFEPLLDDRVRPIQERIIGWDVASKIHEELNKLGGIKPPREFVFMDRATVGIGSVLFHLRAELNWHRLFEELIENFSRVHEIKCQRVRV